MKTYTEEQVQGLIADNLDLLKQVESLKDQLSKSLISKECAERKYNELCERCIRFYITERDITADTIFIQVTAPRFMTRDDFSNGVVQQIITQCTAEREKRIFHDLHIDRCKEREDCK